MIKNTYADCKVKQIRTTGSTAYVTLLIYSTKPAENHRRFKFYLADEYTSITKTGNDGKTTIVGVEYNNNLVLLSQNTYWIDRTNNYDNLATNVDTNMYKEIILEVDITCQNQGEIRDNRWVRECQIIMKDITDTEETVAWVSPVLTLVSTEITLPQIRNLSFMSDKDWKLYVDFDYEYESQRDFNYQNKNIYTVISVVSNSTRRVLESIKVKESEIKDGHVRVIFSNPYDDYVRINLRICNNRDVGMMQIEKLYRPQRRVENTYVKHNGVVYKVNYIYYKGDNMITGGPILND